MKTAAGDFGPLPHLFGRASSAAKHGVLAQNVAPSINYSRIDGHRRSTPKRRLRLCPHGCSLGRLPRNEFTEAPKSERSLWPSAYGGERIVSA